MNLPYFLRVTSYEPEADGQPDPGEVVWGWVPYEEDPSQGKDRPVLLVGRTEVDGVDYWAGLMLTSKDHDRDAEDEARYGRHWMDIGAGAWDAERRPSEVRLDRLVILRDDAIRREGAAVSRAVFDRVVTEARRYHAIR
jgi:PemK-like, MazF-like toxin of type II toxin-antitoxin system